MHNANDETVEVYCPGCREACTLPKTSVGDFAACPSCGLSIAIDWPAEPKQQSTLERAYSDQLEATRVFQQTQGLRRIAFRVFRLKMFSDWETLFNEATDFANKLAPEALINISHSGGEGVGACGCNRVVLAQTASRRRKRMTLMA